MLRLRNMLMVNERDRVRRESEKLQSAARQAARKAQLAALHIQQMPLVKIGVQMMPFLRRKILIG